ncbi:hypothetical protein KM043_013540 [Ampulex compressa]|nr:hypothetical protein KM043_013540 [Ampulex compressa]
MKLYLIAALLFVAVCATFGAPSPNDKPFEYASEIAREPRAGRHARGTCQIGKATGDVACIIHCGAIKKSGGSCRNGICVCTGESIRDAIRRIAG